MRPLAVIRITLFALVLLPGLALAQQAESFGPFELHYSVVNTTFLDPKIAATYGIVSPAAKTARFSTWRSGKISPMAAQPATWY
jgi:hypothetical protein